MFFHEDVAQLTFALMICALKVLSVWLFREQFGYSKALCAEHVMNQLVLHAGYSGHDACSWGGTYKPRSASFSWRESYKWLVLFLSSMYIRHVKLIKESFTYNIELYHFYGMKYSIINTQMWSSRHYVITLMGSCGLYLGLSWSDVAFNP